MLFLKYWFLSNSFFMLLISLASTTIMFNLPYNLIVLYNFSSFSCMNMSMTLMIDYQSSVFISTVSTVSMIIFAYSFYYFEGTESQLSSKKFMMILMTFVISMFILSTSGNLFWMMIGWDGLGISSLCLIIFYQNWSSFSSGMVTFLSNRLGDVLIIISLSIMLMNISVQSWMSSNKLAIFLILGLGAYSKSAQIPFLFWLPQAMAAPTPVSALVHSSTLVTAGVYTFCRFSNTLSGSFNSFFLIISFITMVVAGSSSMMEFDLKKIIAFSTLCHISLMMVFSIMNDLKASMFHLMMHAYFKSMLFMIAGYLIHVSNNFQDIRMIKEPIKNLFVSIPFFVSTFSMMGFPFLSGFYSKELMLTNLSFDIQSFAVCIMFLVNSLFSCAYSMRIMMMIFMTKFNKKMFNFSVSDFSRLFVVSTILSSFVGGFCSSLMVEQNPPTKELKIVLTVFCSIGLLMGMKHSKLSMMNKFMVKMMSSMWMSNNMYKFFQKNFFLMSHYIMWLSDEKGSSKMIVQKAWHLLNSISNKTVMFLAIKPTVLIKFIHVIVMIIMMNSL